MMSIGKMAMLWGIVVVVFVLAALMPLGIYFGENPSVLYVLIIGVVLGLSNLTIIPLIEKVLVRKKMVSTMLELVVSVATMSVVSNAITLRIIGTIVPFFDIVTFPTAYVVGAMVAVVNVVFVVLFVKKVLT